MPEDAQGGETEGRNRDEENEESQEQGALSTRREENGESEVNHADTARRKDSDSDMGASGRKGSEMEASGRKGSEMEASGRKGSEMEASGRKGSEMEAGGRKRSDSEMEGSGRKTSDSDIEASGRKDSESERKDSDMEASGGKDDDSEMEASGRKDSEIEASGENLKNVSVKYELLDVEEVKEEDDDDDYDDYDENEDYWGNSNDQEAWEKKMQKKREEQEKNYVWLRQIDKETYVKVMTTQYLFLEVQSASPLQVHQIRQATSHLSRVWPWWDIGIKHRGQDRTPWLCVAPSQQPHLHVTSGPEDEYEDELWDLVEENQLRHKRLQQGMLSSVILVNSPFLAGLASAIANSPHPLRNENQGPPSGLNQGSGGSIGCSGGGCVSSTTDVPSTSSTAACETDDTPGLPHKAYLMLGIPRPFVDDITGEVICHTLLTLLDDVLSGKIQDSYKPDSEVEETRTPDLESWVAERLQVVDEVHIQGTDRNIRLEYKYVPDIVSEQKTPGYTQKILDSITSKNFINKCKAERVGYVNGFSTCVSNAAASFMSAMAKEQGESGLEEKVVMWQRVLAYLYWPYSSPDWHDEDHDDDDDEPQSPRPSTREECVLVTAPTGHDATHFWRTAKDVGEQRLMIPVGTGKEIPLHIPLGIGAETEGNHSPTSHLTVKFEIRDIKKDESINYPMQRVGSVAGCGPHYISPLRHWLLRHKVDLALEPITQVLKFSIYQSTAFLSMEMADKFADEIEVAVKNSIRQR